MVTNVTAELDRIRTRHSYEFDRARDETRTAEWQKQHLAKAYRKLKTDVEEMLEREQRDANRSRRTLHAKVFGAAALKGDPASLVVSMRDAADRAEQLKSQDQAMALLGRAERTGDESLARAVVQVALERDWPSVGNAFIEAHQDLAEPLKELWTSHGESVPRGDQFQLRMVVSNLKPPELHGLPEWEIDALATGDDEPAAAPWSPVGAS